MLFKFDWMYDMYFVFFSSPCHTQYYFYHYDCCYRSTSTDDTSIDFSGNNIFVSLIVFKITLSSMVTETCS